MAERGTESIATVDQFYLRLQENFDLQVRNMELQKFTRPSDMKDYPTTHDKITLNIGGVRFETLRSTLTSLDERTRLTQLNESSPHYDPVNDEYFFDRNPSIFEFVLEYYRNGGSLHVPNNYCGPLVKGELDYWGITEDRVATCCQADYREYEENMKSERALMEEFQVAVDPALLKKAEVSYKYQLYLYLEFPHSSAFAQVWAFTFALLTILSILVIFLETLPAFRTETNSTTLTLTNMNQNGTLTHARKILLGGSKPNLIFQTIEMVFIGIFTIEFVFRLIMSPRLILFVRSFTNFIDLLCLTSYWVTMIIYLTRRTNINYTGLSVTLLIVRLLQVLRVFRIFKLAKQYIGFKVLILSLRKSMGQLMLLLLIIFVFTLIFAALIFLAELSETQSRIENIPTGLWWAVITLTTIGYGDVFPEGVPGKILGSVCAFVGMVFAALCVPIVTGNFLSYHKQAQALDKIAKKHHVEHTTNITMYRKTYEPPTGNVRNVRAGNGNATTPSRATAHTTTPANGYVNSAYNHSQQNGTLPNSPR